MLNKIKHFALFGFLALLISLTYTTQGIAEELILPQQVIQSVSEQLQQKLRDKSFTKDFAQVTQYVKGVIFPHTDFNKIAPLVLGKHWKTATPEEQERFNQEFQTLLTRTYSRAFVEYNDWTIRYLPIEPTKDTTKVIVKTEVLQRNLNPVDVNYRMILRNGEWKVYDIMLDGVSLVTNYRASFSEEIKRKGSLKIVIDELTKRNIEALAAKDS